MEPSTTTTDNSDIGDKDLKVEKRKYKRKEKVSPLGAKESNNETNNDCSFEIDNITLTPIEWIDEKRLAYDRGFDKGLKLGLERGISETTKKFFDKLAFSGKYEVLDEDDESSESSYDESVKVFNFNF